MTNKPKQMKGVIHFTEDSPFYKSGEKSREVKNLTEVHYSYPSFVGFSSTAFESDIDGTGFTIRNDYIKEFEIKLEDEII